MNLDKNDEICNLIDTYSSMLTERQKDVLHDYYFLNLSLSEIAENYDITRQAIKDILDRGLNQCYNFEEKLHIYSNLLKTRQKLNKILQLNDINKIKEEIINIINDLEV